MASTGEVASFGRDVHEAYWAALLSTTGFRVPRAGSGVLLGGDTRVPEIHTIATTLAGLGFRVLCASPAMEHFLERLPFVHARRIAVPRRDKRRLREVFDEHDVQCVINIARKKASGVDDKNYVARRCV